MRNIDALKGRRGGRRGAPHVALLKTFRNWIINIQKKRTPLDFTTTPSTPTPSKEFKNDCASMISNF
jgi:hypothetical protein